MRNRLLTSLFGVLLLLPVAQAELSDPTRPNHVLPVAGNAAGSTALQVSAVFISGDRRIAIVNGQRVRVGETVGGATVSSIDRNKVSFVRGDRAFTVSLLSGQSRQ